MTIARLLSTASRKTALAGTIAASLVLCCVNTSFAGPREQAWRMYQRLTGTPPSNAVLAQMTACINGDSSCTVTSNAQVQVPGITQGEMNAAYLAMKDPNFLSIVVKNMVTPWTNKDQTVFFPLNDASATLIGMVRDNIDFRQALYGDFIYIDADKSAPPYLPFVNEPGTGGPGGVGFNPSNNPDDNGNYTYMEQHHLNMQDTSILKKITGQGSVTGMPANGVAGVLTTRAMQRAFFYAGTNRAMLRFTFINFMCSDLPVVKDVTGNPDRIRQDPSRSPGGDSNEFLHNCIGCHSGMDGLAGAYAHYNWGTAAIIPAQDPDQQGSVYDPTTIMPKYLQNSSSFPDGYVTTDDSWVNYWRVGPDANLGWGWGGGDPNGTQQKVTRGKGMKSMGVELANTYAFAQCQALTVYRHVCFNDPTGPVLDQMTKDFRANSFQMKVLFGEAAVHCSSDISQ